MLHVVLDWQKISENILENTFLFSGVSIFLVFVLKNFRNGPPES
jgi:hypothetical protein